MLRAVLATALAVALLAASLPPIDQARRDNADAQVRSQLERLSTAAREISAHDDAVPVGTAGARRTLTLRIPSRGWRATGVDHVAIGGVPGNATTDTGRSDVLAWRVTGGPRRILRIEGVDLHTVVDGRVSSDERPLVVRAPGRHVLELSLVRRRGGTVVLVRGFKPHEGARVARARSLLTGDR